MEDSDLRAISRIIDEKLDEKLLPIKADLQEIKEGMEEVRGSVAAIVDWIDEAEHEVNVRFPVKDKAN